MAGTFQRQGKEHIRYIREMARKSFERSNGTVPFDACLVDAMKCHRDYIKKLCNAVDHYNKSRDASYRPTHGGYSALNDN